MISEGHVDVELSPRSAAVLPLRRIITIIAFVILVAISAVLTLGETTSLGRFGSSACTVKDKLQSEDQSQSAGRLEQKQDLIRTVDRNWCPHATCQRNHLCRTCERRFLIIIASGRSASTTLTWMLDKLPNVRMSGENNDLIKALKQMVDVTFGDRNVKKTSLPGKDAWGHNPFPPGDIACVAQTTVEAINPPVNVSNVLEGSGNNKQERNNIILGFKTIRLHRYIGKSELSGVVNFLRDSFPCARFVVNYRSDIKAQAISLLKSFDEHQGKRLTSLEAEIQEENERLRLIARQLGSHQAYSLDSVQWTKNVTLLNEMLRWLGFNEQCYFSKLLEFNVGPNWANQQTTLRMNSDCQYSAGQWQEEK